ncbi:MAG: hypothetical protein Q7S65_01325, partial [Nanoarchaeota archaeon]|nr:hypothetical protein [Nanoarchaeota archaeon]
TSGSTTMRYKGTKFTLAQENGGSVWQAKIDGRTATFLYLPQDIESIPVPPSLKPGVLQFQATSDVNSTAAADIAQALFRLSTSTGIPMRNGFTTENRYGLPAITCANATQFVPVLSYRLGEKHEIRQEGQCIIVESNVGYGFNQLTDRISYALLGVIP